MFIFFTLFYTFCKICFFYAIVYVYLCFISILLNTNIASSCLQFRYRRLGTYTKLQLNGGNLMKKNLSNRAISAILALIIVFISSLTVSTASATTQVATATLVASACYPGSNYLGTFTFTESNIGSNRTIYGNRMRFCIAHKAADSSPYVYNLWVACVRWDGVKMKEVNLLNYGTEPDANGYYFYVSDWFDISYGGDYHLVYHANTFASGYEPRTVNIHAWYDVE